MPEKKLPRFVAVNILLSRDVYTKIERRSQEVEWTVGTWCARAVQWRLRQLETQGKYAERVVSEESAQAEHNPGAPEEKESDPAVDASLEENDSPTSA